MPKRILFLDDDQSLLVLYRRDFSRLGYEVLIATDVSQALEVFQKSLPDAVVVDVKLTGERDGLDFLSQVLAMRRVPAVINTAYASFRESFFSWAADAYLLKSSDLTELVQTLERLLLSERVEGLKQRAAAPVALSAPVQ